MQIYRAISVASPKARLDGWNERLSQLFSNLTADPFDASNFDGCLAWGAAGSLDCAMAWAKRCRMYHGAETAGRESSFLLKIQISGRSHIEHLGLDATLAPGDLILFDTERMHRLTLVQDSRMLAVRLPKSLLGSAVEPLRQMAGLRLAANNPSVRLCRAYAERAWALGESTGEGPHPADGAPGLGELLLRCAARSKRTPRGRSRYEWSTIERYLQRRAFEPDLSITRISSELGITPRWLQRIFAEKGATPGRYILDLRLQEASRRLSDAGLRGMSVTEIAFDVGFGDLTYFGRAFRSRYGLAPNSFRKLRCFN